MLHRLHRLIHRLVRPHRCLEVVVPRALLLLALTLLLTLPGCAKSVRLKPSGEMVETVSQEYVRSGRSDRCQKLGEFEVVILPSEEPANERYSVAEIKARNGARQFDATHVLLWPSAEFACDDDGAEDETSEARCTRQPVTAYQCLFGRGS